MTRLSRIAPLLLVPAAASAQEEPAPSWPCWRGPDRTGVSPETSWDSAGRPEPLWRAEVGLGYSNVAIAAGRLVTLGHDPESGLDSIVCLDAARGDELWRHTYPVPTLATFHGGGTLSTPAIDGDRVYVKGRLGRFFCFDAESGAVLWERDFKEELELPDHGYGFSASPVVAGDRLIVEVGGKVLALDARERTVVWKADSGGPDSYATPVPFRLGERECLAVFADPGLIVLDLETGEELYRHGWKGTQGSTVNAGTPIVAGDRVFISSGYGAGAALLRLGERPEPEVVWTSRGMRNKVSGCVLLDGHVYGFDEAVLKCISFEDGTERWRVRGLGMGAVTIAGERLVALTSRGELVVAEATPEEYRELSRRKVLDGGVYWTTPVLLGGLLYCRNSLGHLVCLDHRPRPDGPATADRAGEEPARLPAAADLFARHAALVGGEALQARASVHLEGIYSNRGGGVAEAPVTIDWTAPDRWRMAFDLGQFGEVVRCHDGELGWCLDAYYGNRLMEDDERRAFAETHRLHGALDWAAIYPSPRTTGQRSVGGRDCWTVAATTAGGAQHELYFDAGSGFLAGLATGPDALVTFEDYRDFGAGVKLPARTTELVGDTGEEEVVAIHSAVWDAVDEAAFARPPEVLELLRTPEEVAADEERLRAQYAAYLGTYSTDVGPWAGLPQVVSVRDGRLVVESPEGPPFPLAEPDAEGRFYFPPTSIYATFRVDEDGKVTAMVMHGAPGAPPELVFERQEDESPERRP